MQNERLKQETVDTYNGSAPLLAEYFRGIGPRVVDIDLAFDLAGNPEEARVVEIGCGDGRDASDIAPRAAEYTGFDISEGMIELAREHVPDSTFEVADALEYEYPDNLDIVFAFASLLHLDKEEVAQVLDGVHGALRPGGIFYISLKEREAYEEKFQEDVYGGRLFFYYNPAVITEMASEDYDVAATKREKIGSTDWFEIALKKR